MKGVISKTLKCSHCSLFGFGQRVRDNSRKRLTSSAEGTMLMSIKTDIRATRPTMQVFILIFFALFRTEGFVLRIRNSVSQRTAVQCSNPTENPQRTAEARASELAADPPLPGEVRSHTGYAQHAQDYTC
jgi:hypothetical protein